MTPPETRYVRKRVEASIDDERKLWLEHTKAIMRAATPRL